MHAGQRVNRDLLGVLLGVFDLLEGLIACNLGKEHLVLGFLTSFDARLNELGRRGLQHIRIFVTNHRWTDDSVGVSHRFDVVEQGHLSLDPVAR
ncbi:hypothetical protein D3C84_1018970 [compost metagenome]